MGQGTSKPTPKKEKPSTLNMIDNSGVPGSANWNKDDKKKKKDKDKKK